jgi:hypothetical protein
MRRFVCCIALLAVTGLIAGCGNPQAKKLGQPSEESVSWEPLDALYGETLMMAVEYGADMGDFNSMARTLTSAEFKSAVDAVASAPLPGPWAERTAQRDAFVQACKDLIAAAEGKKGRPELQAGLAKVRKAVRVLNGQEASSP